MMWYSHGDLGWPGWTLMVLSMVAFWGLVIWGVLALTRSGSDRSAPAHSLTPQQVLAHRFAAGEIDADSYQRARSVLAGEDVTAPNPDADK